MSHASTLWFVRKSYGWGWTPATREGWLAIGIYTAILVLIVSRVTDTMDGSEVILQIVLPSLVATATLIAICYAKGEQPRWQWGDRQSTP